MCSLVLQSDVNKKLVVQQMRVLLSLLVLGVVLNMIGFVRSYQLNRNVNNILVKTFGSKKYRGRNELNMNSVTINSPVRVRFAPSPTGSLHVGGARTALFNWLLAKKTKGKFLIRVEDTDEARSTRESETSILNDLKWMNLNWDEGPEVGGPYGPYRQSERKEIYKKYAEKLIADGKAYRCFCTEEELDKKREEAEAKGIDAKYDGTWRDADPVVVQKKLDAGEPYTVRFRVPDGKVVFIDDIVRGRVTWDAGASLGDFIILRSNGMPVYNYCVAVDDANMQITHVIRAEEHLTNTLRQMLILEALGYKPPTYAHCSLILGSDRSKLSKRHGATSVKQFSEQGFLPEAMINYLANLGWNDGTAKEIYSPQELIDAFDVNRIIKNPAMFDMNKLKWINGQHLRALPPTELQSKVINILKTHITDSKHPNAEKFLTLASKIAQRDMELLTDAQHIIINCLQYNLDQTITTDPHVLEVLENTEGFKKIITTLISDYESNKMPRGNEENIVDLWKTYMKDLGKTLELKGKALFHPVRLAITGRMSGPEIADQIQLACLSEGVVNSSLNAVNLANRIEKLKSFNPETSKNIALDAVENRKKEELLKAKQLEAELAAESIEV